MWSWARSQTEQVEGILTLRDDPVESSIQRRYRQLPQVGAVVCYRSANGSLTDAVRRSTPVVQVTPLYETETTIWRAQQDDVPLHIRTMLRSVEAREAAASVARFISTMDHNVTSSQHAVEAEVDHAAQMVEAALRTVDT